MAGLEPIEALAALVPSDIREQGYILAAKDPSTPPFGFYDAGRNIVGIDHDVAAAVGRLVDLEIRYEVLAFSGIVGAIASGRYDMSHSGMFDTVERQQQIDFVDYFFDGNTIITQRGNPEGIQTLADFCGKTVAIQEGTVNMTDAQAAADDCPASSPMQINGTPSQPEALLQIQSGRAVATIGSATTVGYIVRTQGLDEDLEVLTGEESVTRQALYGIGFNKEDSQLRDAVHAALNELMQTGVYDAIMDKWSVPEFSRLDEATINGTK